MSTAHSEFREYRLQVAAGLTVALVLIVGSKLVSGGWAAWFNAIPPSIRLGAGAVFLLWIGISARKRALHSRPFWGGGVVIPDYEYQPIGELPYCGVLWGVRVLRFNELDRLEGRPAPRIDVQLPPRCPKCQTELEEQRTFWGRYRWTCIQCKFEQINANSYYEESERAERLAQSKWEKTWRNGQKGRRL